jgi:hypothetical protein
MQNFFKKYWGHLIALVVFIGMVTIYFSPSILDGKVIKQGDTLKFVGMVQELSDYYNKDHQVSAWLGSMFSGMPSYQVGMPGQPANPLTNVTDLLKKIDPMGGGMVFTGLIAFYILMCVIGVNRWLAIAGAIAYALASYNFIIIDAGHISKAYAIAYMPITLSGMFLLFKRKYLWGAVLFILGAAFSVLEGHLQITYYLVFFCGFVYLGFVYLKIKEKDIKELLKVTGILIIGVLLAITPNAANLYSNYEMSKTSLRGTSELTSKPGTEKTVEVGNHSSGLDKDYAFQWSYGWKELFTVLVPDVYGGSSGGTLDSSSELYQQYQKNGVQTGQELQAPTYWGDKPFTSGPVYFGAIVCFLFVLGMFVIRNPMKWWIFAGGLFFVFLALGKNFASFNDFMFYHLPMYNKFRTPEMALVIPGLVFPIIGFWGLKELFDGQLDDQRMKKSFLWALGLTGIPCLIIWLMPSMLLNFHSTFDAQFQSQVPAWFYPALLADRASLASADALRSLIFILLIAGLLFVYWKSKNKQSTAMWISACIAMLMLIDLWSVDRRYLNDNNFSSEQLHESYKATVADNEILKDKDPSYRVLNLNDPWQDTSTSYYHKSIGGYHAAKLRRYQELIDHRLSPEYMAIIKTLQKAKTAEDVMSTLASTTSLDMLNMRYIIYNPEQAPIRNPYAYGNAWFVGQVQVVNNADAEIASLDSLKPLETAVVDKRFADDLKGFVPQKDTTATIVMTSYKPNVVTYKSKAASEQLAVFSEIYYQPGWKAFVDGKLAPHFRADWTLRAMRIPAGEHQIEFKFIPDGYNRAYNIAYYGGIIILLLFAGAIVYSVGRTWKQKKVE